MRKKRWAEAWGFSYKERLGLLLFVILVLLLLVLPDLWLIWKEPGTVRIVIADTLFNQVIPVAEPQEKDAFNAYRANDANNRSRTLFQFDPNTLDAAGWKELGLPPRSISTIMRYREKGGRFKKAEDIHRIYGLSPEIADRLEPFVKISAGEPFAERKEYDKQNSQSPAYREKRFVAVIDINEADSAAWEELPGIGAKLAHRILQFRNNLGGFYTVEQLKEVYGLPDSTYQKIISRLVCNGNFQRIDINSVSPELLSQHPYIKRKAARIIVAWRQQHGSLTNEEQLIVCGALDSNSLRKLRPYLIIEKIK